MNKGFSPGIEMPHERHLDAILVAFGYRFDQLFTFIIQHFCGLLKISLLSKLFDKFIHQANEMVHFARHIIDPVEKRSLLEEAIKVLT